MSPDVLILDGGLATELERRGYDISGPLWSARVLLETPEAIEQLHYDYLGAGADCVITASYQASYEGFAKLGLSTEEITALLLKSVSLAESARDRFAAENGDRRKRFVAASIGPYGATLHDGSEYHGNYGLTVAELTAFHEPRFAVLAESIADVLACETIPSLDEARALAGLLSRHPATDAWFSFTSPDGVRTAHGEKLVDCARFLDREEKVIAVGVNCVHPRIVETAIRELIAGTDKRIVVYPNSGERWDIVERKWTGVPDNESLAALAPSWVESGASIVGGCCRTGPKEIADLARALP
ncbi:MAG: homocysteine S-methyltransferase [Gemmatimonadaceae bacterium]